MNYRKLIAKRDKEKRNPADCVACPLSIKNNGHGVYCDELTDSEIKEIARAVSCKYVDKKDYKSKSNAVNHPLHYQGQHECIDVMRVMFGDEAVKGFCKCNAYKYRFRAGQKDGNTAEQDIKKAEWYENYLFEMEKKE